MLKTIGVEIYSVVSQHRDTRVNYIALITGENRDKTWKRAPTFNHLYDELSNFAEIDWAEVQKGLSDSSTWTGTANIKEDAYGKLFEINR